MAKKFKKKVTDYPSIEITVKAYDTRDQGDGEGGRLVFYSFPTDVSDGDGNSLGFVSGGTGYVVISFSNGPYFMIPHDELWNAFQEALKNG